MMQLAKWSITNAHRVEEERRRECQLVEERGCNPYQEDQYQKVLSKLTGSLEEEEGGGGGRGGGGGGISCCCVLHGLREVLG